MWRDVTITDRCKREIKILVMSDSESTSIPQEQEERKDSDSVKLNSDDQLTQTPLLDGKYFRVESVTYGGKIKASCNVLYWWQQATVWSYWIDY